MGTADVNELTAADLIAWFERFHTEVSAQSAWLTELDSEIGDADHGTNMARGATALLAKVGPASGTDVGAVLRAAGMALISTVGGASGPLYGTLLIDMGKSVGAVPSIDLAGVAAALGAGLDGVVKRGRAEPGDKTMVDALVPAVAALHDAATAGEGLTNALAGAAAAAKRGRDATEPLVARKGRASYLGERSAGHLDPGAASTVILLESLADSFAHAHGGAR